MSQTLIHIGYPKAGSTFLQKWFFTHPNIGFKHNALAGFDNIKEMCEFTCENEPSYLKYFAVSSEMLSVWFKLDGVGINPMLFDIKQYQRKICLLLKQILPGSKLLVVTRGYEETLKSFYSEYIKYGGHYYFDDYLKVFGPMFEEYLDYNYIIRLYEENFQKQNMLVIPFETLRDDPLEFIQQIEKFLDLEHFKWDYHKAANISLTNDMLYSYRMLSDIVLKICKIFPGNVGNKLFRLYSAGLLFKCFDFITFCILLVTKRSKTDSVTPTSMLKAFSGKGTMLRDYKTYQPYLDKYLLC